jgi:hypothetical protein
MRALSVEVAHCCSSALVPVNKIQPAASVAALIIEKHGGSPKPAQVEGGIAPVCR